MSTPEVPLAVDALAVPPRTAPSIYPAPFAALMVHRRKTVLGDLFGLTNFGVNLTRLAPGGISALRHSHVLQDEFVYVLEGNPTLVTNEGEVELAPGHCSGYKAGTGRSHQLVNRTDREVVYLEIGDRSVGDAVHYPEEDLRAEQHEGRWRFLHKDGTPY